MATSWHEIIKTIFSSSNGIAFVIIITIFLQSKNDKDNLKWKTLTRCKITGLYLATNFGTGQNLHEGNLQAGIYHRASSLEGLLMAPCQPPQVSQWG